jgi:hypothetical protein
MTRRPKHFAADQPLSGVQFADHVVRPTFSAASLVLVEKPGDFERALALVDDSAPQQFLAGLVVRLADVLHDGRPFLASGSRNDRVSRRSEQSVSRTGTVGSSEKAIDED